LKAGDSGLDEGIIPDFARRKPRKTSVRTAGNKDGNGAGITRIN